MNRRVVICTIIGALLTLNSVWGDDYNPPTWRGEENTTTAEWGFGDSTNPSAPDSYVNTVGIPSLDVTGSEPFTLWLAVDEGHGGVWKFEDFIQIGIPNFDNEHPYYKEIWMQLTFAADGGSGLEPIISTIPGASSVELIDKEGVDEFYWHATYQIIIEPNPDFETIYIQPRDCTMYVDQIVIDTRCVPEPTTICLLGLGALALLRKRRA